MMRVIWLVAAVPLVGAAAPTADEIVSASGFTGGMVAVVGAPDAALAMDFVRRGKFVVHCLARDAASRDRLRREIREAGMAGAISADIFGGERLPYADNLINIVVDRAGIAKEELSRVLVPGGTATGASAFRKPWPEAIDEWGHFLHAADGNPVARDSVVGPPERYQWIAEPLWLRCHETDSSVSTLVTSGGRLFAIVDEAPISLPGNHPLPDKWALIARDAFNGAPLWKVPIQRWGWREWKDTWWSPRPGDIPLNLQKRLVASGDRVYVTLGYRAPVSELDARNGAISKTYDGTAGASEILLCDGKLFLTVQEGDWLKAMAVDAASGKTLWATQPAYRGSTVDYVKFGGKGGGVTMPKLDPSLNSATDGKILAGIDGTDVVGIDCASGAENWRTKFPVDEADKTAAGMNAGEKLWIGTMIVKDGVVVHASPNKLAAMDATTGRILWEQPKKYIGHLWYEWKDVFVIDGLVWTWGADLDKQPVVPFGRVAPPKPEHQDEEEAPAKAAKGKGKQESTIFPTTVKGYDLRTGEIKKDVALGRLFAANHHHRCYRNKATEKYIIASRRGFEYVDLSGGEHVVDNWVRTTCHLGTMPANGLQYNPPHPCACYIDEKLTGFNALAAAGYAGAPIDDARRLERGPAFGDARGEAAQEDDWPAFRRDAMRTGWVQTSVPDGWKPLWSVKIGSRLAPPIAVGDRVYVALVDEHHLVCLDRKDGRKLWEYAAGGRIDSSPTYHEGALVFGSADGDVHCVRASDGALAWRFRAAPAERLIGAFGQLESAWPVHGSVLVREGVAYFAAGRSSHLDGGIRLYALDAATGEIRHRTTLEGPDFRGDDYQVNLGLPMGHLTDVMACEGDHIYMRSQAFDAQLQKVSGKPEMQAKSGFLDDTYFKRTPWSFAGNANYGRLIARDNRQVYYVRMFDSLKGLDPTVYFTPGQKGYLVFGTDTKGKKGPWMERVSVRVRAMALANDRLFLTGPPDVVDPKDPLGAFEGRKGALLYCIDAQAGKKTAEYPLASPPVFNGIAAARGRLFLALEDGSVACFGSK